MTKSHTKVIICVYIICIGLFFSVLFFGSGGDSHSSELVLVHLVFRHGDRTPDKSSVYPNDPYINYTYPPYGEGHITEKGRQRLRDLGKEVRNMYKDFLSDNDTQEIYARATTMTRTHISLEEMFKTLYPKVTTKIPYEIMSGTGKEKMMLAIMNDTFADEYLAIAKNEFLQYQETFDYLTKYSGYNISSFGAIQIYHVLKVQEEMGLKLPEWTKKVYPKILKEIYIQFCRTLTMTDYLQKVQPGILLSSIIETTISRIKGKNTIKINLYSAHDINLTTLLTYLGVFDDEIPNYGSCIFLEIHKKDKLYFIKVLYKNKDKLMKIKLPDCELLCPLQKFLHIYKNVLPDQLLQV